MSPEAGPRPPLVSAPRLRVSKDEADFQLLEGLRFTIHTDHVERHWDEGRVPADIVAAQEAGPVWALQRHLRHRVVLHAGALVLDGKAICIAARSGTGKSTLAAALRAKGAQFLSDDLSSIRVNPDGPDGSDGPVVEAGPPHIRLWPDTLAWAGLDPQAFRLLMDGHDKRITDATPVADEVPLGGVIFLERGEPAGLEPVPAAAGVFALAADTYVYQNYLGLDPEWETEPWHFAACAAIAGKVPLWRLRVPEGLENVGEGVEAIMHIL